MIVELTNDEFADGARARSWRWVKESTLEPQWNSGQAEHPTELTAANDPDQRKVRHRYRLYRIRWVMLPTSTPRVR